MTEEFKNNIHRTLAYYEIFDHPLTMKELFLFFPANSLAEKDFRSLVEKMVAEKIITGKDGYYFHNNLTSLPLIRIDREKRARGRIRIARFMSHIIKRFPFVRGVFLSGDVSKGVATPPSDLDYVIITAPGRLWICRTLLILFKKIFLLNRKKYFCLNYFIAQDNLNLENRNYYTATEVAHLKPVVNFPLFLNYMNANAWIREYFPNYSLFEIVQDSSGRPSSIQKLFELLFAARWADRLDNWLMNRMKVYWAKHYPQFTEQTRENIFRCSKGESRAYAGNFSERILNKYQSKLSEYHLS